MANTAGMDISVRRIIGAVLAALLAAIIHAGAKSHSEPEQGIASFVGAHEFELKSRQSPFDTLGIERTPRYGRSRSQPHLTAAAT